MEHALIISTGAQPTLGVAPEAAERKEWALVGSRGVVEVKNDEQASIAVSALRDIGTILRELEASRTAVKKPALDYGRAVDALARDYAKELEAEEARLKRLTGSYAEEQRRIAAEAARKRQEEIDRAEREKREAAEREQKAKEEAARKEREAQEALERAARARSDEGKRKAREAAEKAQREADEQKRRAAAEQQEQKDQETARLRAQSEVVVAPKKQAGTVTRKEYDIDVVDIVMLHGWNASLVRMEVNREAVLAMCRQGVTAIPGLRITVRNVVGVRS